MLAFVKQIAFGCFRFLYDVCCTSASERQFRRGSFSLVICCDLSYDLTFGCFNFSSRANDFFAGDNIKRCICQGRVRSLDTFEHLNAPRCSLVAYLDGTDGILPRPVGDFESDGFGKQEVWGYRLRFL